MSSIIAKDSTESNAAQNIKDPSLSWIIGFLFTVSFLGLFSVLPLRKVHSLKSNKYIYTLLEAYLIHVFENTEFFELNVLCVFRVVHADTK